MFNTIFDSSKYSFNGFAGLGMVTSPPPEDTDMGTMEEDPNAPKPLDPAIASALSIAAINAPKPPQNFTPTKPNVETTTSGTTNGTQNPPPPADTKPLTFLEHCKAFYKANEKAILVTVGAVAVIGIGYNVHQSANKGLDGLGKSSKTLSGFKKQQFNKKYSH